jgi:heterodisulfide reductase subunit C
MTHQDLALGLALRAHDKTVWAMFRTPAKHLRRQITALLRRDNKALAQKQEDVTLMARCVRCGVCYGSFAHSHPQG